MIRLLRTYCLCVLCVLTLCACASAGRQFDRAHISDVKKGVQTKDQIRQWFGQPYQVTAPLTGHPAGCVERWTYTYARSTHGGAKTTSASLVVDFDGKGTVCDHAYSETGN